MDSICAALHYWLEHDKGILYTNKSAKEISGILGFDDIAAFSRFFKKMTKESISEYRKREKQD